MTSFRPIEDRDIESVVALWIDCGLVRPWNDARRDIDFARGKPSSDILVGIEDGEIVSSVLVGHDGHRGWYYYLSVAPARQGKGLGRATVEAGENWLKERGIWVVGTADDAPQSLYEASPPESVAWVLGAEGEGMRQLTRAKCDLLVSIPMLGACGSLNVSVAAGVVLYETRRRRLARPKP